MLGFGGSGELRQALVIGNSSYAGAGVLPAAKNDAAAIARALTDLGFNVRLGIDRDYASTLRLFEEFEGDLSKEVAKVGLLYYSGHGVQIDGVNYLMPVGAETETGADFGKLIAIEPLVERMSKQVETRLVVLDACRNNPFSERLTGSVLRPRGYYAGAGSTPIKPDAGLAEIKAKTGTFIAFAAAPGGVAYEATGEEHSKFTAGLLRYIEATDVPLGNLMIRVRNHVLQATNGEQNTWDHSSLRAPFFFNPGALIMLVGNAIGLVAFAASLLPCSFSLHASLAPPWIVLGVAIALASFTLFLAGLQRAYRLLRGGEDAPDDPQPRGSPSGFQVPWRRALFGGFFGGMIAAPITTMAYYFAFETKDLPRRPAFGLLLTEITIACVIIGLLLGLLALSFAEYCARIRSRSPQLRRVVNPFNGALLGGIIAGIICGPWTTLYFSLTNRPFIVPQILLIGAIAGTAVMVFSILNYTLEQVNLRTITRSGGAAIGAALAVGGGVGLLLWSLRNLIEDLIGYQVRPDRTVPEILTGGLAYGVFVGIVLGAVFGLTLVWMAAQERAAAK
jgi:hypothetical protein